MTATPQSQAPDTSPQITIPEGQEGIASPDQSTIVEEYQREKEELSNNEKILGKFNNVDELLKSYQELEKKVGQPELQQKEADPEPTSKEGYTPEDAINVYGKEAVETLAAKGVNLSEVMYKADSGEDVSEHYDTFAEAFNVSRQVVENYVNGARAVQSNAQPSGDGLTEQDETELKNMVGGEESFGELGEWAKKNLAPEIVQEFDSTVDSGNKEAVKWAIRALNAEKNIPADVVEPKLYGGGDAPAETRFESKQQVLDAMNKKNDRGQRLYDVDSAYRQKVESLIGASDVFAPGS
tara:strand:- start:3701 stop:4588 length:888 start_codon:yes stop_codon:yes gene_type:complete